MMSVVMTTSVMSSIGTSIDRTSRRRSVGCIHGRRVVHTVVWAADENYTAR